MDTQNKTWLIVSVVGVAVLIGVVLWQRPDPSDGLSPIATTTATTTVNGVTGTGDFTVSSDPITELNIPDFTKPLTFDASVAADVRVVLKAKFDAIEAKLEQNSLDLQAWLELAGIRKIAGDFKGAAEAWEFVTDASPNHSIAFNNLGDLYMNFIKDYPKAESAYLKVISLSPKEPVAYRELGVMYINFYKKGTSAAEEILKKGIVTVPDSVDLRVQLARHYKATGRTADAKVQYDAAIATATRLGQATTAAEIRAEASR